MDVSRSVDEPPSVLRLLRMYDVLDSRTSFTPYSPVVSIRSSEKAMPGCHEQTTGRAHQLLDTALFKSRQASTDQDV